MMLPKILQDIANGKIHSQTIESDEGVTVKVDSDGHFKVTYPDNHRESLHPVPTRNRDAQTRRG